MDKKNICSAGNLEDVESCEVLSFVFEIERTEEETIVCLCLSCFSFCIDQEFDVYPLKLGRKLFEILPVDNLQRSIVKHLEYFSLDYACAFLW